MITGWYYSEIKGQWYYLSGSGKAVTGWKKLGKNWYYFSINDPSDPYMCRNKTVGINDDLYLFDEDGVMVTGWHSFNGGRTWYYCDASGLAVRGWNKIGGKWYYFTESIYYPTMVTGFKTIGSSRYYFDSNGAMVTGWLRLEGKYYYLDQNGRAALSQWLNIDGKWYYFASDSHMLTGYYRINGVMYHFKQTGECTNPPK